MRKVIVSNIMSDDGYYDGPERNVIFLNMDEAFDASRTTWTGLLANGLVDELHLTVSPAAIGDGRRSSRCR